MRPNRARKSGVACGGGVYSGGGAGWIRHQQQQDSRLSDAIESPLRRPYSSAHLHELVATGGESIAGALDRLQPPSPRGGFEISCTRYVDYIYTGMSEKAGQVLRS